MSTQVILTNAVDNLGDAGAVVSVADGYARNYLLPKGLAVPATPGNLKRIEIQRQKREKELTAQTDHAQKVAEQLAERSCTIKASASADGKLFGSVTAVDIVAALKEQGVEVERRQIHLDGPLRELGSYDVEIRLHPDIHVPLKVWVVSETEAAAGEAPAPAQPSESKARRSTKK